MAKEEMYSWDDYVGDDVVFCSFYFIEPGFLQKTLRCRYTANISMLFEDIGSGSGLFKIVEDVNNG